MGERAALRSFVVAKSWSKSESDVHLARNFPNALKSVSALRIGGTLFYNNHQLLREGVCSLLLPHRIVETACPQKLVMSTLLDHCSLLEHDNQICEGSAHCQVKKNSSRDLTCFYNRT